MGSLSLSTYRGLVHWQRLLLVVSILNYWCPPTTAQFIVVPTNADKGTNVTLYLQNTPPNVTSFVWYRGEGTNVSNKIATFDIKQNTHVKGPAYSGREEILHDGALLLTNVTLNDTGNYTVEVYPQGSVSEVTFGELLVYELVKMPLLLASHITNTENKDVVILTCPTNAVSIQWLLNGTDIQLSERRKLSEDHRSLTIDPVEREDAGDYQCKASNTSSNAQSWFIKLQLDPIKAAARRAVGSGSVSRAQPLNLSPRRPLLSPCREFTAAALVPLCCCGCFCFLNPSSLSRLSSFW